MTKVDSPVLVTVDYAAAYLMVTTKTIKRRCLTGEIPAIKFGRRWYIRKDRLEQMFDPSNQVSTSTEPTANPSPQAGLSSQPRSGGPSGGAS